MSDDYVWDRTGPPDPEVVELERLLARYRSARVAPPPVTAARDEPSSAPWRVLLALAAVALIAVGVAWMGPSPLAPAYSNTAWALSALEGRPTVGTRRFEGRQHVPVGPWIETDEHATARLEVGDVGRVDIAPNSRLRIVRTAPRDHRLHLDHGTLDALIWAPPGQVVVSTPAVTAVDLGCAYTLTLDRDGTGTLRVTTGWVGLVYDGREAFIPAGAAVAILGQHGPGTPVFVSAADELVDAVRTFDLAGDVEGRRRALAAIVDAASPGDALTLWHLFDRVTPDDRVQVYDALAVRLAPPDGVTRDGIAAGDRAMIDAWWAALGHGDVDWWRLWQREWRGQATR